MNPFYWLGHMACRYIEYLEEGEREGQAFLSIIVCVITLALVVMSSVFRMVETRDREYVQVQEFVGRSTCHKRGLTPSILRGDSIQRRDTDAIEKLCDLNAQTGNMKDLLK